VPSGKSTPIVAARNRYLDRKRRPLYSRRLFPASRGGCRWPFIGHDICPANGPKLPPSGRRSVGGASDHDASGDTAGFRPLSCSSRRSGFSGSRCGVSRMNSLSRRATRDGVNLPFSRRRRLSGKSPGCRHQRSVGPEQRPLFARKPLAHGISAVGFHFHDQRATQRRRNCARADDGEYLPRVRSKVIVCERADVRTNWPRHRHGPLACSDTAAQAHASHHGS